jgi:hypothetical protein
MTLSELAPGRHHWCAGAIVPAWVVFTPARGLAVLFLGGGAVR